MLTKRNSIIYFSPFLFILFLLLINPAESQTQVGIGLTWSANTYIPANYPGKALPTRGSLVEVVVQIENLNINPQELTYNWFLNNELQKNNSGKGKQTFRFNIGESITKTHLVKLELFDRNNFIGSSLPLSIRARSPEIVLKAENGTIISSSPNLSYLVSASQPIRFKAQPYFFDIKNVKELNYSWYLDGKEASQISSGNPNLLVLKVGELMEAVKKNLTVSVENRNNPLQKTNSNIQLTIIP
jgi:hypothetical protein